MNAILHGGEEIEHSLPHLFTRWLDLGSWEDEAVGTTARWSQLNAPADLGTSGILHVVSAATGSLVESWAGGARGESGRVDAQDGASSSPCKGDLAVVVWNLLVAVISVWEKDELGEAVPIDVELDTLALGEGLREGGEGSDFNCTTSSAASEGLAAWVGGGTAGNGPLIWPVSVHISADAAAGWVWQTVLAPQSVAGLREDETYES